VLDVIAGSPAAEAGLKVGDKILAIDGQSTEKLLLPEVRLKLKNDAPQKRVQLLVETNGERRKTTITLRDLV
jgi:carboxyl-terminal processing protease